MKYVCFSLAMCFAAFGQTPGDAHIAAAKAAAGQDHQGLFAVTCGFSAPRPAQNQNQAKAKTQPPGPPERSSWHAEPAKVFDNLYFVGQTEYSAWAVTTSEGIIVLDTIFDYSVEDEVAGGLKKLGLDPSKIKYALVSHAHADHSGGAWYLQEHFGTHILMSAADWDLLERTNSRRPKPRRDMVVTDGQKLTLGDTTLTFYLTPGHTPGTVSTIIPVTYNGKPHVAAEFGGSAFNFTITPGKDRAYWFNQYIHSANHFREAAAKAGADVLIANHTNFDGSKTKLPLLASRKPGDPNPYVVGADSVNRYLTVASECAEAGLADLGSK